ncbi:MAG: error-prone DNA polymerase, partial [Beijerinckiaceae bacterium]
MSGYAELVAATNFSFLRGASPAEHMVLASLLLGHAGLGVADRNTVAGVVRAHAALKELREGGALPPVKLREGSGPGEYKLEAMGPCEADDELKAMILERAACFRLTTGARLAFDDGTPDIIAHPENRRGWGRLCRLLTIGNRRARKGKCLLGIEDLLADARDLLLIVAPTRDHAALGPLVPRLKEAAPGSL